MPGETYNTLKEKFTKQQTKKAEQAGASPQEAKQHGQNVGGAMAANAAIQGGSINVDKKGNITQVQPDDFMTPFDSPWEVLGDQTYYPSGKPKFLGPNDPELQKDVALVPQLQQDLAIKYPPKEDTTPPSTDGTGIIQAAKEIGSNLLGIFSGPEIQRLTPSQRRRVEKILAQYQALGVTNPNQLRGIMANNIGGWLTGKDQTFSDMEGNIVNPDELLFEGNKMFHVNEDGQKVEVRRTKEGTIDLLKEESSGIMKSLQKFHPELYYPFAGTPGTMGGLEDLAGMDATKYPGTDLAQMIFDARNELDRQQGGQGGGGGGGGAGIPSLAAPSDPMNVTFPSVPPDVSYPEGYGYYLLNPPITPRPGGPTTQGFPDADGDGIDDRWQAGPGQPFHGVEPVEGPLTAPTPAATTPTPHDYSQWPQFGPAGGPVPNYVNQGLGVSPQFDYWNQIAKTFPGMR